VQSLRENKYFKGNRQGFAIVIVLLVTTLVIVLSLEFNYEMRVDANITLHSMDSLKAYYLAKSGVEAGIFVLRMDFKKDADNKKYVDYLNEQWNIPSVSIPLGKGSITGSISDESGKINLNYFIPEDMNKKKGKEESGDEQKMHIVRRVFEGLSVKPEEGADEIAHALLDWRGAIADDALDAYYSNLEESYFEHESFFEDTSELLLVKGITKDIYFQRKKSDMQKVSGELSGNGGKAKSKKKKEIKAFYSLGKLFTVYGENPDNNKYKININTAPKAVLRALHSEMDESLVERIAERQASSDPFASVAEVGKEEGLETVFNDQKDGLKGIKNIIDVKSYTFRIISTGRFGGISKTVEAIVYRSPSDGSINIKSWSVF